MPQEREAAIAEVEEELRNPDKAIRLLPLAHQFCIQFDPDLYWERLALRDQIGGLDDKEIQARFVLAKTKLSPREFLTFLEEEEFRLGRLLSGDVLVSERILALLNDSQTTAARRLLEDRKDEFEIDEYQRISLSIDAQEGKDPRVELERLYESKHLLIDLRNLTYCLGSAQDWRRSGHCKRNCSGARDRS
jgi:hypothetical protein